MTPERWRKIEEIFQTVIERAPDERKSLLTQYCGGDDELRREVESLLDHQVPDTFIQEPIRGAAQSLTGEASDELIGRRLGAYRVARMIGRGGMGAVYEAARADEKFERQVAIKIIKRGMDTDFIRDRFTRERRILARLEHPHIARLIDGGETEDGLPYFVMEFVEGRAINEYCEANQLSINERLRLFRQVCAAVQFAHQNLVIHRDIKPSNILIGKDGAPKLLDFGIAKMLSPDTSEAETRTVTELRLMTPEYASPEQVRGKDITTASDIYSLGVVLYELLTGARPHQFKTRSPLEIERAICDTETEKPSVALSRSTNAPAKLRKQLAGDLDNIVLMAMRKEPERRYQSVEQFSEDIRRHLEGLPVIARQDTINYRAGKFIRRHKLGVAATALVIASLGVGVAVANYQARRAERRFQQVRKLANTFLFDFHDKIQNLPGSTEAREMVVKTALEYLDNLANEAGGDPTLEWELATAYQKIGDAQGDPWGPSLGHSVEAMRSYEKAMALAQKLAAANPEDLNIQRALARSYFKIGTLRAETGDKDGSYDLLRQSIKISEEVVRRNEALMDVRELSNCYVRLGDVYLDTGDARTGLEFYQRALKLTLKWEQEHEKDDWMTSAVANHYGHVGEALASLGDLTGSIENYRQGATRYEELARRNPDSAYHRRQLWVMYTWLGNLHGNARFINLGDKAAAEKYYRRALTIAEEIAAADPKSALARLDLIACHSTMGDILAESNPASSIEYYRKALAVAETLLSGAPNELRFLSRQMTCLRSVAAPLLRIGQREAALRNLRQSLQIARRLTDRYSTNPQVKTGLHASLLAMANAMLEVGDYSSAQDHYKQAQIVAEELAAVANSDVYARWRLADSYEGWGQYYAALASDPKIPAAERVANWREASGWHQKSFKIWDDWSKTAVPNVFSATRRDRVARLLAECDAALAKLAAP